MRKIIELFKNSVQQRKPGGNFLLYSAEYHHRLQGILWALKHLGWTITQWKHVLWSDQSVFQIFVG